MEYSTVESTNPSASIPAQWWVSGHWCFVTNVLPSGCLRKDFHRKKTDRKRPYLCRHSFGTDLHPATSPSLDSTVCSLKTCAGLFFLSWFPRLFRTAPVDIRLGFIRQFWVIQSAQEKTDMVLLSCNPNTWEQRQENWDKLEVSLGYLASSSSLRLI